VLGSPLRRGIASNVLSSSARGKIEMHRRRRLVGAEAVVRRCWRPSAQQALVLVDAWLTRRRRRGSGCSRRACHPRSQVAPPSVPATSCCVAGSH